MIKLGWRNCWSRCWAFASEVDAERGDEEEPVGVVVASWKESDEGKVSEPWASTMDVAVDRAKGNGCGDECCAFLPLTDEGEGEGEGDKGREKREALFGPCSFTLTDCDGDCSRRDAAEEDEALLADRFFFRSEPNIALALVHAQQCFS